MSEARESPSLNFSHSLDAITLLVVGTVLQYHAVTADQFLTILTVEFEHLIAVIRAEHSWLGKAAQEVLIAFAHLCTSSNNLVFHGPAPHAVVVLTKVAEKFTTIDTEGNYHIVTPNAVVTFFFTTFHP